MNTDDYKYGFEDFSNNNYYDSVVDGFIVGAFLPYMLSFMNVLIGIEGVNYYAEIHTTSLNSICHTIGMPFTTYGLLLWLPVLIGKTCKDFNYYQGLLYTAYMTHYMSIDFKIGLLTSIYYYFPYKYAYQITYNNFKDVSNDDVIHYKKIVFFIQGFMIFSTALLFQEIFGHWLSGDEASRLEGIPNAILYSMYFSVSHLF